MTMVVLLVCHLQPLGFFRLGQIWENTFANKFLFLNLIRNDHKMIQNFFLIGNRFLMSSTYETFGKILLYKTKWLQITYTIQISKLTTFHFFKKTFLWKLIFLRLPQMIPTERGNICIESSALCTASDLLP